MQTTRTWWFAAAFILEVLLPGAARFVLVLWLSRRYFRDGFTEVRHHAFAPVAAAWSVATLQRSWWSCDCASGACACLATARHRLRRCCLKLLDLGVSSLPAAA